MECRCYRGGEGRTRLYELRFGAVDVLGWIYMAALLAAIIGINMIFGKF